MPSIQDTIYPRIKYNLSEKDLEESYTPLQAEIQWAEHKSRGNVQQLGLLVLINTIQKLGFSQFFRYPSNNYSLYCSKKLLTDIYCGF